MIYPFFSAILPELLPGKAPEISLEEFDLLAAEQMGSKKAARLDGGLPIHRRVESFRDYLAYRTAVIRASRLKSNIRFEEPAEFYGEVDYAVSALSNAEPTEREVMLDAVIWSFLDDLAVGHELDTTAIAIYRMKLAMLQKYAGRDEKNALANFENALEKLSAEYLK